MATGVLISEQEYLRTVYDPDVEFVEGALEERYMGEQDHSSWQEALILWFGNHRTVWQLRARPELRVNVAPGRYRVPDITLVRNDEVRDQILDKPPIAVFEILSPDDRLVRVFEKLEEYERMGIPNIIIVEPMGMRLHRKYDTKLKVVPVFHPLGWAARPMNSPVLMNNRSPRSLGAPYLARFSRDMGLPRDLT